MKKNIKFIKYKSKLPAKERFINKAVKLGFTKKQAEFLQKVCFDY